MSKKNPLPARRLRFIGRDVCRRIFMARKILYTNRKHCCSLTGISEATLCRWENYTREPYTPPTDIHTLMKIASIFKVDIIWLLFGVERNQLYGESVPLEAILQAQQEEDD